jgi:TolB-like protein/Flp pilus assembly protein TadD
VPEEIKARLRKEKLHKRKRAILYAVAACSIIVMAVLALSLFTGRAEAIDSIAVLPLDNLTGDAEQEFFVDAATDELIGQLAQIGAWRVISRRSVMQYKGVDKPLPDIARELNVDALVEGTVYQVGENVRIRVQLIDALPEERNLWAETYNRAMTDVLAMYGEMARAIADKTQVKLTADETTRLTSTRPVNPEAYEAYQRGRYFWNTRTREGLFTGIDYFQQAIDIDPDYALGYVGLADSYGVLAAHGYMSPNEALPLGKKAVMKALAIDNTIAEAYAMQGFLYYWNDRDWSKTEQAFKHAIKLNPSNASVHQWYAEYLAAIGRHDEAIAEAKIAQKLDPLSPMIIYDLGEKLYYARRFEEVIAHCLESLELFPNFPWTLNLLGCGYRELSRFDEAVTEFQKAYTMSGGNNFFLGNLGLCYGLSGQTEKAKEILDDLIELSHQEYVSPLVLAYVYLGLGQWDKTFENLDAALEGKAYALMFLNVDADFDPIREDPRFQDLLQRLNLLD